MKELKEIRFNEKDIYLQDNLVRGSILPERVAELNRNIIFEGNNVVEGPVYAHRIEIRNGDLDIKGSVFSQLELYINTGATGDINFRKCVGSADSVVTRANNCKVTFHGDINAKSVTLYNAFVAGSIYADEIILDNCVVIGGIFATHEIELKNSIVGTFNSPLVRIADSVGLLLPSAFSIEPLIAAPGSKFYNLALADLGSLFRGLPQSDLSGKIEMDITTDEIKTSLADEEIQKTLRSYTVIGKVLAADLIDTDKFQNHFLLTAAALGTQLLKTYDLGLDKDGKAAQLTIENIREFFFNILSGKLDIKLMDGKFDISQITGK